MRLRPDFRAAVSLKNRLHRESGEEIAEPISPAQKKEMALFLKQFMVGHVRLELVELFFFLVTSFLLQLVSFTVDGDPL